ncbi:LAFA_0C10550g1_1 [Lachancea sp. 'fantastica']|nr:LAFA_0C10550g1_1 [Lachancea sp. 'fantastica']
MPVIRYRTGAKSFQDDGIVRRTERRSKNGCLTCRRRRKKCNEVTPKCGGCARNGLECEWPSPFVHFGAGIKPEFSFVHVLEEQLTTRDASKKLEQERGQRGSRKGCSKKHENSKDITISTNVKLTRSPSLHDDFIQEIRPQISRILGSKLDSSSCLEESSSKRPTESHQVSYSRFNTGSFNGGQQHSACKESAIATRNPLTSFNTTETLPVSFYTYNTAADKYLEIIDAYDRGKTFSDMNPEDDEELLFYTCVNRAIPNLGTQYTHPLLTTCATFLPQVENSAPLREIFLCYGATYLEWYDEAKFSALSDELYESSKLLIKKQQQEAPKEYSELWLLPSFLLLCLRCKKASSGSVDECVKCLAEAYLVIRNTICTEHKEQNQMAAGLQNLTYEIENKFLSKVGDELVKTDFVLRPFERMFLESFIYNYSVAILFATDLVALPSPFFIFKELSPFLKRPLYYCSFEWMNNPVLGPSLDAFEILAKVSYIARLPMPLTQQSAWFQKAQRLHSMAFYYTGPVLSPVLRSEDTHIYENAKVSSKVGSIVAKSSYLLVSKILKYDDFDIQRPSIQRVRCEIFEAYTCIPSDSKTWGLLIWSLVITGCFSVASGEKYQILRYLLNIGEYLHHQNVSKMRSFLERAWSRPIDQRLDILFDRDELCNLAP